MARLAYRPAALADLDAIYDFIEPDNPDRALGFAADSRDRCRVLVEQPHIGRSRNDLGPGIRILPMLGRVVAYRITPDAIEITRVFYGGQDYEAILRDHDE